MNHPGAGPKRLMPNANGGAFAGPKPAMPNANGAFAGPKRAMPGPYGDFADPKRVKGPQLNQPGFGGKSKPCAMFFSPSGCRYGDACHFQHHVPGGFNVFAQKPNMGNPVSAPQRSPMAPPGFSQPPPAAVKTRICNKYNTAEGCKFGEKCLYAHGEREMGQPVAAPVTDPAGGRFSGRFQPPQPAAAAAVASFGASATAKISVDASLAGPIIGKNGANTKQIYHVTGAKIFIKDHESDAAQKNIELVGTFDQIKHASTMVQQLITNISATMFLPKKNPTGPAPGGPPGNFKTKLCEKFAKGECTYGDRCLFAHGESELRV